MKVRILNKEPINALSLKFLNNKQEKAYQNYKISKYIWQLRLAHILAAIFFFVAVMLEKVFIDDLVWKIGLRLTVVIPSFLIGLLVTFVFTNFYKKYYKYFNLYYVLITGISFIFSGAQAAQPYTLILYSGLIISLIFNYTFIKQNFGIATLGGTLLLAIYFIILMVQPQSPKFLFHVSIYIAVANFLGIFITYVNELDLRLQFLIINEIENKTTKLQEANEKLESRVKDRTFELEKTNVELQEYKSKLEEKVKVRTLELERNYKELERLNNLFIGREFRIKELKDKIKILEGKD